MKTIIISIISLLSIHFFLTQRTQLCNGVIPLNNLWIPSNSKSISPITKDDFENLTNKLLEIYTPFAHEKDAKLIIDADWENGTVNAFAYQDRANNWYIDLFGGLARHPLMTKDAYALIICHELGHHFGGAPKKGQFFWEPHWASSEGQADYYATLKCARRLFEKDDNDEIITRKVIPQIVKEKCENHFNSVSKQALCQRAAIASKELTLVFNAISGSSAKLDFTTPDPLIVESTNLEYPSPQCRLDSYFQGSHCSTSYTDALDNDDPSIGTCARINGDNEGIRPLCWFHP